MVKFLSINFFSWISSIFVGFFKSSRFFGVTLYVIAQYNTTKSFVRLQVYVYSIENGACLFFKTLCVNQYNV